MFALRCAPQHDRTLYKYNYRAEQLPKAPPVEVTDVVRQQFRSTMVRHPRTRVAVLLTLHCTACIANARTPLRRLRNQYSHGVGVPPAPRFPATANHDAHGRRAGAPGLGDKAAVGWIHFVLDQGKNVQGEVSQCCAHRLYCTRV